MKKKMSVTVKNKLVKGQRDIEVYHKATGKAHLISSGSSITHHLETIDKNDYLHISVVSGPGDLEHTGTVDLPSGIDFQFSYKNNITLTHSNERTAITFPPGPSTWRLKVTLPNVSHRSQKQDYIIVSDGDAETAGERN